ncbi:collagen alpha-1(XI) chain-like [Corticium candelabrum]|uniref:collagen alpha-1(XI) chain-like n=1 Tax=Corticium candelabrum TaxID=121492 RepID=UPI002E277516|nr:collagen alpha-1(XI) chain-like [Corticium candelabrum]
MGRLLCGIFVSLLLCTERTNCNWGIGSGLLDLRLTVQEAPPTVAEESLSFQYLYFYEPDGLSDSSPAHCPQDLYLTDPSITDSQYYIDPNLGSRKDSFLAQCNFGAKTANVAPSNKFGQMRNGVRINGGDREFKFEADRRQLRCFLQTCSNGCARQKFTLHCAQAVDLTDSASKLVFYYRQSHCSSYMKETILEDTCHPERFNGNGHIVFELFTNEHEQCLPYVDVRLKSSAMPEVKLEYTVGDLQVCL